MQKKNMIKGTIILSISGIIAKLLGFFFRIPLILLIGEEGIGLYQLTYPLYAFLLALSAGIPIAISKMISERIVLNKVKEANRVFTIALKLMAVFGGISTLGLIIFSKNIIYYFNWSRQAYYSILGISFAPLLTCLLSTFRGYFQGLQFMLPTAISQIIEQLVRVFLGIGLVYLLLPYGIAKAAGGASFGAAAGAAAGLVLLLKYYSRNKLKYNRFEKSKDTTSILHEILKIAIPISLGQTIGSIMALIDSMLVPGLLKSAGFGESMATALYGQLTGKAFVLINVPLTLSAALAQNTVPAISESFALKSTSKIYSNIRTAFKLSMILVLPCSAGLYALARPILSLIFQGMSDGWVLMQILSVAAFFIVVAQTSTSILNGIGKTFLPVVSMIIGSIIKIIFSIIFIPIPELNIKAAAYGTLLAYAVIAAIDLMLVFKCTKVYINLKEVFVLPALCAAIMIFSVISIFNVLFKYYGNYNLSTIISIAAAVLIYMALLILTKTLTLAEIKHALQK